MNTLALIFVQLLFISSTAQLTFNSSFSTLSITDSGMTLYYRFDDKTIYMGLEVNQLVGYCAIGFAPRGVVGMGQLDTVVFVFNRDSTTGNYIVEIGDYYVNGRTAPSLDVTLGGTSDYVLVDSYITSERIQLQFQRPLNTGDVNDYQFNVDTVGSEGVSFSWAHFGWNEAGNRLVRHGRGERGVEQITMANNQHGGGGLSQGWNFYAMHGYVMFIMWGPLVEIAVELGRSQKHSVIAFYLHRFFTFLIYLFNMLSGAYMLISTDITTLKGMKNLHFILAVIISAIATFQTLYGMILGFKIENKGTAQTIYQTTKIHLVAGILLYFLTKLELFVGFYMGEWNQYYPYLLTFFVIVISWRIGQEIFLKNKNLLKNRQRAALERPDSKLQNHQLLLSLLNKNTPVSEIQKNPQLVDLKWAVLDDKVFEIKNFAHPGGNFMLDLINGREVGRFIYGSYGIESPGSSNVVHLHTGNTLKVIVDKFIGTIQNGHEIFYFDEMKFSRSPSEVQLAKLSSENIKPMKIDSQPLLAVKKPISSWSLLKKTEINATTSKFEFICRGCSIKPDTDISNLGRHVKVSHANHPKTRLYTLVLSQTEKRIQRRALLWARFNRQSYDTHDELINTNSETLPLIIKNYDFPAQNTFSSFLHYSSANTDGFVIEGPFGIGFGLTPSSNGIHYIFAAGTGFLPFLDLLDYLLESVLDSTKSTNLFAQGFQLHIFTSFANRSDFVGSDICLQLAQACETKGFGNAFSVTIRAKGWTDDGMFKKTESTFDRAFIEKFVNPACAKVLVCGPPAMNEQIPVDLATIGVTSEKIILV